ncbi:MAG: 1-acyl-sn-glycerol-3-phosphate acyltransferase [Glaciihabitans sp.]|nr:1-acyl-sn-glycerol-3-phosphate acyltransferase [Glaciihabitans sp.]MDQ1571341.1 1-acyl-sn-glycerol-3-phosphate acyltransferase [Actinomycetota bacterium]
MQAIAKFDIQGRENVPATGAFVLAPNHYSNIDPLVVGVAMYKIGRMPRYLAKESLFRVPVLGALMRKSGQVPVQRSGHSRSNDPLAGAGQIVRDGLAIVIYPEGSLTRDPNLWPMRGKFGAVRTALEQNIPLIPAAQWGSQHILPQYSKRISLFPRKKVIVRFGPPVDLSEFRGKPIDTAMLANATNLLMNDITAMLEDIRGEKSPDKRWDPAEHNQSETGRIEPS